MNRHTLTKISIAPPLFSDDPAAEMVVCSCGLSFEHWDAAQEHKREEESREKS